MTWPPIHDIAESIDDLAASLGTPDYSPLLSKEDKPFQYQDKFPANLYLAFHTYTDGTGTIQYTYLSPNADGTEFYELPHINLHNMVGSSNDSELFFVTNPDSCLCSSIFRVIDGSSGGYTLVQVSSGVCCLSAYVPTTNDSITIQGNAFLNTTEASFMLGGNPGASLLQFRPHCVGNSEEEGFLNAYFYTASSPDGELSCVTRKLSGFFTWEAKASHMDDMWDAILEITDCLNNGGAKEEFWKESASEYLRTNCTPTIAEMAKSMADFSEPESLPDLPGCMREPSGNSVMLPWDQPTCEGVECSSDDGPKNTFYCETLLQMEKLISAFGDGLNPYDEDQTGCCCGITIEDDTTDATAVLCGCQNGDEICRGVEESWRIFYFNPDDPGFESDIYCETDCSSEQWGTFDQGCVSNYNSNCPEVPAGWDIEHIGTDTIECLPMPDCADFFSEASSKNTGSGGISNATCDTVHKGSFRFKMDPPFGSSPQCSSAPSITVKYDMVLEGDDNVIVDELVGEEATLSWDPGEWAFVSGWIDYPSGITGSKVDTHGSLAWGFDLNKPGVPDGEEGPGAGTGCPRCYYPSEE